MSSVCVRAEPATNWISFESATPSTSVLPHQPRPAIPALITAESPYIFEPGFALLVLGDDCPVGIRVAVRHRGEQLVAIHVQARQRHVLGETRGEHETRVLEPERRREPRLAVELLDDDVAVDLVRRRRE